MEIPGLGVYMNLKLFISRYITTWCDMCAGLRNSNWSKYTTRHAMYVSSFFRRI